MRPHELFEGVFKLFGLFLVVATLWWLPSALMTLPVPSLGAVLSLAGYLAVALLIARTMIRNTPFILRIMGVSRDENVKTIAAPGPELYTAVIVFISMVLFFWRVLQVGFGGSLLCTYYFGDLALPPHLRTETLTYQTVQFIYHLITLVIVVFVFRHASAIGRWIYLRQHPSAEHLEPLTKPLTRA